MKYRLVVTPTAEATLDEIFRFIAHDNPVAARKFVANLRAAIQTLTQMPKRCPRAPEDGLDGIALRHRLFGEYRIIFAVDPGQVTVLQIRHGARLHG
jgi:plasmid stabilization system protein ParE